MDVKLSNNFQYFLSTCIITEILKHYVIVDVVIFKFKMCDNGLINECIFNLSIFTKILSNPGEKSSFRAFIAFIIPLSLIKLNLLNECLLFSIYCIQYFLCYVLIVSYLCFIWLYMFSATFVKYSLK